VKGSYSSPDPEVEIELLLKELFRLHDLNRDGLLEELELIQLNKKIAMLHHGEDVDKKEVAERFHTLFRSKLDPLGRPVSFPVFRDYMKGVLREIDRNPIAQNMILEQFIAEADSAQKLFRSLSMYSASDEPLLRGAGVKAKSPVGTCVCERSTSTGWQVPTPSSCTVRRAPVYDDLDCEGVVGQEGI
jgi:hypothetical protein